MNVELWKARKERGLTQARLAELVGIKPGDIILIERNDWVPPAAIRQQLAVALEAAEDVLFTNL